MNMPKKPSTLTELKPDPHNARRHTPDNLTMIADSLDEFGAGRSILIDGDDQIIAGHGVVEAAKSKGITKLQVVEADGDTIIAVRRADLSPEAARRLGLFDNRTAELAEWDIDVLAALAAADAKLIEGLWSEGDFSDLIGDKNFDFGSEDDQGRLDEKNAIACPKCGHEFTT
jgi:ParB-like chromosome segregation protein Spo0J